jgi:tRNA-guanine family transglycosylase
LDTVLGGLREQCLAGFRRRAEDLNYQIPGYAIGGLAGGESKDEFWRVVDQACRALPDDKPRYLMGVGYPLDLVVCSALGVDMYDCVYPTRTARFGVALVPGKAPGTLRLTSRESHLSKEVIQSDCGCQACRQGISRARLHALLKARNPLAVELITQHNIAFMMALVRNMRKAIFNNKYGDFVQSFLREQYPGNDAGGESCPQWVIDALDAAGIKVIE